MVHFHPFDADDKETLSADPCADAIEAVRTACPEVLISLSTSSAIEPDPDLRIAAIETWHVLPDFVSVNMGEEGVVELCSTLARKGVRIEAGLLSVDDARAFAASGLAERATRVLVEPLDTDPVDACRHASEMERVLAAADIRLPQVHHGELIASWYVNLRALSRSHGIRTGIEDTDVLPNGRVAQGNADLIAEAVNMINMACR